MNFYQKIIDHGYSFVNFFRKIIDHGYSKLGLLNFGLFRRKSLVKSPKFRLFERVSLVSCFSYSCFSCLVFYIFSFLSLSHSFKEQCKEEEQDSLLMCIKYNSFLSSLSSLSSLSPHSVLPHTILHQLSSNQPPTKCSAA